MTAGAVTRAAHAGDLYLGHPKLLFEATEVPALRSQLADGGDDDAAYAAILTWSQAVLPLTPQSLLGSWEGLHAVAQLGLAAQIELDGSAYAAKVREMVLWLVDNRAPTNDEFGTGVRLQSLALGYDLAFADATPEEREAVRGEMRAYLDYMPPRFNFYCQAYNPYCGNHGMTVGTSMGLACIALWDDVTLSGRDSLAAAFDFAEPIIDKCLSDILPADGAYREGVLYAGWILRVAAPYFEARRRFDGLDYGLDPRFARLVEWLCYELAPDGSGRTNNLNDAPWSTRPLALHGTILEWAQARWNDPLAKYLHDHVVGTYGYDYNAFADRVAVALWSRPIAAVNPATQLPSGRLFADRGLYYYRSAWKTAHIGDEVQFAFSTGKFYGGHIQEDRGQFTLAALGQRFAVDCGGVGANPTPKETAAHNLVLCDGLGQHNAGNSVGTDGQVVSSLLSGFADYVRADARDAYATHSEFNAPGYPFPTSDWSWGYDGGNPLERADRTCVVVKGGPVPAWVMVADDVRKDASPHAWDWLLHTSLAHTLDTVSEPARLVNAAVGCDVFFAHPPAAQRTISSALFQHGGVDPGTRRIAVRATTVEPRFAVVLLPRRNSDPQPVYTASDDGNATTIGLDWGSVQDVAIFNPHQTAVTGDVETDGTTAIVRRTGGVVTGYLAGDATTLRAGGIDLVVLDERGSIALADDTLHVSSNTVRFSAWGPAITDVQGPDGPLLFERDGDYVHHAVPSDAVGGGAVSNWIAAPHPNPATDLTTARFAVARAAQVRATVVDVRGAVVATLADGRWTPGTHTLQWNGIDRRGHRAAAGVYFLCLDVDGERSSRKLVRAR